MSTSCTRRTSGDRFLPYRYRSHIDLAHHKLATSPQHTSPFQHKTVSEIYCRLLASVLGSPPSQDRLFVFSSRDVNRDESQRARGFSTDLLDSCGRDRLIKRRRQVVTNAESVRDLPGFADDFYSHLMDWGANDNIVVAIGNEVYMWNYNAKTASEHGVIHTHGRHVDCEISALLWKPSADNILVACNEGDVMLWDVRHSKMVNEFSDHKKSHIGSLAWLNDHTFVSGSQRGTLAATDIRCAWGSATSGRGAWVCGMQVSPDGRYLLVGRDDGLVQVWDARTAKVYTTIVAHRAGVRAVAWCPWQRSVVTTGGGASDGHIRQFNIHTKQMLFEVDCKSQVCEIVWSADVREMASSHGVLADEGNNIELWLLVTGHPYLVHIASFCGHRARPMHLSLGVDNVTIASASGDESLRLWKAFRKREGRKCRPSSPLELFTAIR